jgi:hypothetical protein
MTALRAICAGNAPAPSAAAVVDVLPAVVETPTCGACEGSMVEGRGKLAGQWACGDVSCSRYGLKQKETV